MCLVVPRLVITEAVSVDTLSQLTLEQDTAHTGQWVHRLQKHRVNSAESYGGNFMCFGAQHLSMRAPILHDLNDINGDVTLFGEVAQLLQDEWSVFLNRESQTLSTVILKPTWHRTYRREPRKPTRFSAVCSCERLTLRRLTVWAVCVHVRSSSASSTESIVRCYLSLSQAAVRHLFQG